jgi:hypothetical protein
MCETRSLRGLGLTVEQIRDLDTGEYFVAILKGLDRVQPKLREQQIEDTRTMQIVGLEVMGDTAEVSTRSASGLEQHFTWIRESSGWKIKATSVGKGLD